jgi:hypothetical protein
MQGKRERKGEKREGVWGIELGELEKGNVQEKTACPLSRPTSFLYPISFP